MPELQPITPQHANNRLLSFEAHAQVAEALFDAIAASEAATPSMRIFVAVDKADVRRQAAESTARLAPAAGKVSARSGNNAPEAHCNDASFRHAQNY